jgi:signal recognition particle subunit SRP19
VRKQDKFIVWPMYFESTRTRTEGRRVPKNLAVPSPKISEVKDAADKLGLNYELVADAAFPKMPWLKSGMILVEKRRPKEEVMKEIAKELMRIRSTLMPSKDTASLSHP